MSGFTLGGVGLEIVRGCNFRCKMCPSPSAHPGLPDFMTRETAELIVERMNEAEHIASIWSFGLGEPCSHPDIYELFRIFCRIKRGQDTPVLLYTNASCLTGEAAYAILELPWVTQLYISFDGYGTKESYEYLRGAHFHEVIDNVRNFMIMAKRKKPGLYIGTSSIYPNPKFIPEDKRGGNFSQAEALEAMKQIFEPMGVHVGMRALHKYNAFYTPELYKDRPKEEWPTLPVLGGCRYLEEHSFVLAWDGKVRPCHDAINDDFVIGDLRRNSFREILSDELFLRLRHSLRLDRRCDYRECENCDKYSFGEDIRAAANYWKPLLESGEISDPEERTYLSAIVKAGDSV